MHVYSGNSQTANGEMSLNALPLIRTTGPVIAVGLPAGEKTARQCILATTWWNVEGRMSVEDWPGDTVLTRVAWKDHTSSIRHLRCHWRPLECEPLSAACIHIDPNREQAPWLSAPMPLLNPSRKRLQSTPQRCLMGLSKLPASLRSAGAKFATQ